MPLFKLLEDYKGWKAGVTVRLFSQDHIDAMGRGIGELYTPPPPKPKVIKKTEPQPREVKKPEVKPVEVKTEVSKDKPKPKGMPALHQTFNARNRKQKGAGKKRK